jgi:hypothetical protein
MRVLVIDVGGTHVKVLATRNYSVAVSGPKQEDAGDAENC